jgi:ribosomal protein S18 acetylase RimI-like enzyme
MIRYRTATSEDNNQLIELASAASMDGSMPLRIDRGPDFFGLLRLRGETHVFVAVSEEIIVGSISVSTQSVHLNHQIEKVRYIGDFKVAKHFRGSPVATRLCEKLVQYATSENADFFFLAVAQGNTRPFPFLHGRGQFPKFTTIGCFHVHQFPAKKWNRQEVFHIKEEPASEEVVRFLNDQYREYALGPNVTAQNLNNTTLYVVRDNGAVHAVVCLIDTMGVKQNVITKMPWRLSSLLFIANAIAPWVGMSRLPRANEPIHTLYIRYIAVRPANQSLFRALINCARDIAYKKGFSFVSLGLHERDPLNEGLRGMMKFTFYSRGMMLSMKNNQSLVDKVKYGVPFEDYSLV